MHIAIVQTDASWKYFRQQHQSPLRRVSGQRDVKYNDHELTVDGLPTTTDKKQIFVPQPKKSKKNQISGLNENPNVFSKI
jgi:hypothetical protein